MRGPFPDLHMLRAISIFKIQFTPFPDLHRAISIFKIQFAGAVMRGPFPDLHRAISIFKIQFAVRGNQTQKFRCCTRNVYIFSLEVYAGQTGKLLN